MGVYWECQRCTACCRWPGEVKVSEAEIGALAVYLGMEEHDFIQRYTRLRHDRQGLALAEQGDGACIFLRGCDCVVQAVKPRQCREFPNGWRADPELMRLCQAKPVWRPEVADDQNEAARRLRQPIKVP